MSPRQYTVMMNLYGALFLMSYGSFLLTTGEVKNWSLAIAVGVALVGLLRSLQRPYQEEKTKETE